MEMHWDWILFSHVGGSFVRTDDQRPRLLSCSNFFYTWSENPAVPTFDEMILGSGVLLRTTTSPGYPL